MSVRQIVQAAEQAGFRGAALVTAVAVALAESGGDPTAHATKGEDSRGLWQINVAPGAHPQLAGLDLYDPLTNAQQAFAISGGGANWSPWTTYTGGKYRQYLAQAVAAIAANAGSGIQPPHVTPPSITLPSPPAVSVPNPVQGASDAVASAVNGASATVGTAIANATAPLASGIGTLTSFLQFAGNPNVWVSIALIGVGILVTLLGLIFFGISLVPRSVARDVRGLAAVAA